MPRKAKELKPVELSKLPPGRHAVGAVSGLYLQVPDPNKPLKDGRVRTAKTWVLRVSINGRRRDIGCGGYPEVGLSEARDRARKLRTTVFEGRDPLDEKRAARSAIAAAAVKSMTFKKATEDYIKQHAPSWRGAKSEGQWSSSLETYAYPVIRHLDVGHIQTGHVVEVLKPIWNTKTETASRVRGRIESIIAYADKVAGRERLNPARWKGHLDALLPKPSKVARVEHHAALPIDQMHDFMVRLRAVEGQGARALEFAILTAARSGEVRGATWKEIDLQGAVWTIPGKRMKAEREHRVPLSQPAVELLRAQGQGKPDELVFKGAKPGQPLSDMTLTAVLRRMEVAATAHGMRSSFRDWAAERTHYPHEVAEMALAHSVGSKVEAAYRRGDLFEKRRMLMADWATFIDAEPQPATVTPIRSKKGQAA